MRKNKETPRDFYANDAVWSAVYAKAVDDVRDAMDLAYLTGQRPADVLVMGKDDITPIFDPLEHLDSPWVTSKRLPNLRQHWREISKTMDSWADADPFVSRT